MKDALKIIGIYDNFLFLCYNKDLKINNERNSLVNK